MIGTIGADANKCAITIVARVRCNSVADRLLLLTGAIVNGIVIIAIVAVSEHYVVCVCVVSYNLCKKEKKGRVFFSTCVICLLVVVIYSRSFYMKIAARTQKKSTSDDSIFFVCLWHSRS